MRRVQTNFNRRYSTVRRCLYGPNDAYNERDRSATVCIREMESEARKQFENGELAKEPPASALIVGLSANVGPEHVSAIQKAGMDGTLSKPFYPSTLRGLLRDVYLGRYMGFREADSGYVKNAQAKPGN